MAEVDALTKQERETQRETLKKDLVQSQQIQEVEQFIRLLTGALLVATHHYTHKRQWRKRRGQTGDHQEI